MWSRRSGQAGGPTAHFRTATPWSFLAGTSESRVSAASPGLTGLPPPDRGGLAPCVR